MSRTFPIDHVPMGEFITSRISVGGTTPRTRTASLRCFGSFGAPCSGLPSPSLSVIFRKGLSVYASTLV